MKEIEYKGKRYKLMGLHVKHKEYYPEGAYLYVAPESLGEDLQDENSEYTDPKAIEIDELIYHYIPDDVFEKGDKKEIAEHYLDEPMELMEE